MNAVHTISFLHFALFLCRPSFYRYLLNTYGFPGGSVVKTHLPIQETCVHSLGWKIPWRRKWQPTLVFLPGKSHGERSLAGYNPQGHRRVGHNLVTKQ